MSFRFIDTKTLPKDPEKLIQIIQQQQDEFQKDIKVKDQFIEKLQGQLESHIKARFGSRTEKLNVQGQMFLFDLELPKHTAPVDMDDEEKEPKKRPKRKKLTHDLEVEEETLEVSEDDRQCDGCGKTKEAFGEVVSDEIEYIPASFRIKKTIRPKYSCQCKNKVLIHPMPTKAIPRSNAGTSLLSYVLTSKYCDHIPLHRLIKMMGRHGVEFSESTLNDWVMKCADMLKPIADYMKEEILISKAIHTDDTRLLVITKVKGQSYEGRLYVYLGDEDHPYVTFDFTPDKKGERPRNYMKGFTGFVHADAYPGYDRLFGTGKDQRYDPEIHAIEVACWAHTRRKFHEALETAQGAEAKALLFVIKDLYMIERKCKLYDSAKRKSYRDKKSKPILSNIKATLVAAQINFYSTTSDKWRKAVNYALNHWEALNNYLLDGDLHIDNNPAERAIRGIAIGRKNWMFTASDRGGRALAIMMSLVETCKRHKVDPYVYLHDALKAMADSRDLGDPTLAQHFTPLHWKKMRKDVEDSSRSDP